MLKRNLLGIISSKDLISVTPELIEILHAKTHIIESQEDAIPECTSSAGYCDLCGNWSYSLKRFNGEFLCEECQREQTDV